MRYFHRIIEGIQVLPIMASIARQPALWDSDKLRTTFEGTPHAQVNDILLRFGKADGDDLNAVDRDTMPLIHGAKNTALDIMKLVGGTRLGRIVITRLEPGKKILPHADTKGAYASYYTRFHLVLQGLPGSIFTCGDETVQMLTGELWWFDALSQHSVANNSKDDRIHMLVDVRID